MAIRPPFSADFVLSGDLIVVAASPFCGYIRGIAAARMDDAAAPRLQLPPPQNTYYRI
jgi:hypothetical protein